jgi:CRISPR/Cas system-associated exonuclease Cas4 (RecB family)
MKNGKWQELECLEDIRKAGFTLRGTGGNQLLVNVGRAEVPGRPDGIITVEGKECLLEIKAMSLSGYTDLKQKGLQVAHPGYYTQVQLYMASDQLNPKVERGWLYAKHKDSCRPYDVEVPKDLNYSRPIIEATDEIVLGNQEVNRPTEPIDYCVPCRHRLFCWKDQLVLDTTGTKIVMDNPQMKEIVEKWHDAKFHLNLGKMLEEEARAVFEQQLGESDRLLVEDLKVSRIISNRSSISTSKFIEVFGAERLPEVLESKEVRSMRVTEVLG